MNMVLRYIFCFSLAMGFFMPAPSFAKQVEPGAFRLGVVVADMDDNFQMLLVEAISVKARAEGWVPVFFNADGSAEKQKEQVEKLVIDSTIRAVVILPADAHSTAPLTRAVVGAGLPLVYANSRPSEPLQLGVGFVGSNDKAAGRIQAGFVARSAKKGVEVAILRGLSSSLSASGRTDGFLESSKHSTQLRVICQGEASWKRDEAFDMVSKWLAQGCKPNVIVANNDEMAIGAINALRKAGLDPSRTLVIGVDATADALAQIDRGTLAATVHQDAGAQGAEAVELVKKMVAGEVDGGDIDVPFELVDRSNYRRFLAY